jgi:uncharacterized membrane protein
MSHGHDHAASNATVPVASRHVLTAIAGVIGLVTLVGIVALWAEGSTRADAIDLRLVSDVYAAQVVAATHDPCEPTYERDAAHCSHITFRLTQGPDTGRRVTIDFGTAPVGADLEKGDDVVLNRVPNSARDSEYMYGDRQRRPALLWLTLLFAVSVIALGRWRGVAALVSLGASIAVILQFLVPSMLAGNSPPVVAILGASAVAFLALYLSHGFHPMTTVALLGTLAALVLTVGLATLFTDLAHFTGAVNEDALTVSLGPTPIDLKGLVLAGMVLGALGALDDVTVTQASAVGELRSSNPKLSRRDLYQAGLRIGRDHISSTVNTLALAYAGASLPLLILFSLSAQSLGAVANSEVMAVAIVSALVGSIGLVAAVPITTWFAAVVATEPAAAPAARARRTGEHSTS